jgi:uncharacterized protein involved in high-affinity Fe2+ transport
MTKKTITVYSLLFLCAFAFGLSFTLTSEAEAGWDCGCCVTYCPNNPLQVEVVGHIDSETGLCTGLYSESCSNCYHFTYQCPPEN